MHPTSFFIGIIVVGLTMLFAQNVAGYDMSRPGTNSQRLQTALAFVVLCIVVYGLASWLL